MHVPPSTGYASPPVGGGAHALDVDAWSRSPGVLRTRRALLGYVVVMGAGSLLTLLVTVAIPFCNYSVIPALLLATSFATLGLDVALFSSLYVLGDTRFGGEGAIWASWARLAQLGVSMLTTFGSALKYRGAAYDWAVRAPAFGRTPPKELLMFALSTVGAILTVLAIRQVAKHGGRSGLAGLVVVALGGIALVTVLKVGRITMYDSLNVATAGYLAAAERYVRYGETIVLVVMALLARRALGPRPVTAPPMGGVYR